MPTERFYHLPKEKKAAIREAAVREFCRVPLEKASINKIVKNADISRGSFYTYFRDKEDVLGYIFEDMIQQLQAFCKDVLEKNGGDIWGLPQALLDFTLELFQKDQLFALTQRVNEGHTIIEFLNKKVCVGHCCPMKRAVRPGGSKKEEEPIEDREATEDRIDVSLLRELYELTDTSKLKVSSFDEFRAIFSTTMIILAGAVGEICHNGKDEKEAKRMFHMRLDYLKYGAVRLGKEQRGE